MHNNVRLTDTKLASKQVILFSEKYCLKIVKYDIDIFI